MIMSSAYIFGRQISAGETPPPLPANVYFENGVFNPLYIPDGFDFANKRYTIDGTNYIIDSIYPRNSYDLSTFDYPAGSLDDGTVFDMAYYMSTYTSRENFELTETTLKDVHFRPYKYGTRNIDTCFNIVLPVKNFKEFYGAQDSSRYVHIRFRFSDYIGPTNRINHYIETQLGYKSSQTKIRPISYENMRVTTVGEMGEWKVAHVFFVGQGNVMPLVDDTYFFRIGLRRREQSGWGDQGITLEIDKIWSDSD